MHLNSFFGRKAEKTVLPSGTAFLIDGANLICGIGGRYREHAAFVLNTVSEGLKRQGYEALLFMERRTYTWLRGMQASKEDVVGLDALERRNGFTIVPESCGRRKSEADEVMLQIAERLPNAVCVSQDRFDDYAAIHPDIVGTDRVCCCTICVRENDALVSIPGVKCAIKIDVPVVKHVSVLPPALPVPKATTKVVRDAPWRVGKPPRKDHEIIKGLAACRDEDAEFSCPVDDEKRFSESERRDRRIHKRSYREGNFNYSHFSVRRRDAAGLASLSAKMINGVYAA